MYNPYQNPYETYANKYVNILQSAPEVAQEVVGDYATQRDILFDNAYNNYVSGVNQDIGTRNAWLSDATDRDAYIRNNVIPITSAAYNAKGEAQRRAAQGEWTHGDFANRDEGESTYMARPPQLGYLTGWYAGDRDQTPDAPRDYRGDMLQIVAAAMQRTSAGGARDLPPVFQGYAPDPGDPSLGRGFDYSVGEATASADPRLVNIGKASRQNLQRAKSDFPNTSNAVDLKTAKMLLSENDLLGSYADQALADQRTAANADIAAFQPAYADYVSEFDDYTSQWNDLQRWDNWMTQSMTNYYNLWNAARNQPVGIMTRDNEAQLTGQGTTLANNFNSIHQSLTGGFMGGNPNWAFDDFADYRPGIDMDLPIIPTYAGYDLTAPTVAETPNREYVDKLLRKQELSAYLYR